MKKRIGLFAVLLVGLVIMISNQSIGADTGLTITSSTITYIAPDVEFSVDIVAENAGDLVGFQTKFLYDKTKYTLVSVTPSDALTSSLTVNDTISGEIALNYVDIETKLNGTVSLFTLTFYSNNTIQYEDDDLIVEDASYLHQFITLDQNNDPQEVEYVTFLFDQVKRGYYGDADLSGYVTILDAAWMQLYIANLTTLNNVQSYYADTNQDDSISIIDVAKVQLYVAGLIDTLEPDLPFEYTLANGVYDFTKLNAENKAILIAAAERYLLENVYGGVPLYTTMDGYLYSDRVDLFSTTYNGILGFGDAYSSLTQDDSTVLMDENLYGESGEYTWRSWYSDDPMTINPWLAEDSITEDFLDLFTGSLYTMYFDESKVGFELIPELALTAPIPINPVEINGNIYASTWQILLPTDLTWTYHPNFDTSVLPSGHAALDANDYLWTWQLAMDEQWLRAVSGGNDFISVGIANAEEYIQGTAEWSDVGLKAMDDYTLQIEFDNMKSAFDVEYLLTNHTWSPINQELYQYSSDFLLSSLEWIASSGVYVFEDWTSSQNLYFSKNPNHPQADLYHYTGQQFLYIDSPEQAYLDFLDGLLDAVKVPTANLVDVVDDPRFITAPTNTTWRMMINAFGTEENRDAYITEHPDIRISDTFVPEPILQYQEMRQALYYGLDRYYATVQVVQTYVPAFTYFTSSYFLDSSSGISVRSTEVGQAIVEDFGRGTYGYAPDIAYDYFIAAVSEAIAEGYYTAGTSENWTTIELNLVYAPSGSISMQTMVEEMERQYEDLLVDPEHFVNLDIIPSTIMFPSSYYTYLMAGNCDLGLGGISGSQLDAPSFLEVFKDDNSSGWTMNWGIDTHTANIEVSYRNANGVLLHEIWSFNAIADALMGKTYINNGEVQTTWDNALALIDAKLDIENTTRVSDTDGSVVAQYVLGDTLENIQLERAFDGLEAIIVVDALDRNVLYVISEKDGLYSLYDTVELFTDPETAIKDDSGYGNYFISATGPMSEADVAANAYLSDAYSGYNTIAAIAALTDAPLEYTELYTVQWNGWDDVYVVLHIDQYYIAWYWL